MRELIQTFAVPYSAPDELYWVGVYQAGNSYEVIDPDGAIVVRTASEAEAKQLASEYALHYLDTELND